MTREARLYNLFSSFGIDAFVSTNTPEPLTFPCLVYENNAGYFNDGYVDIVVSLWYRTDNEAIVNAKVNEIADAITGGGIVLKYDNGSMWVRRGTPFCNSLTDNTDQTIKHKVINLTIEDWRA